MISREAPRDMRSLRDYCSWRMISSPVEHLIAANRAVTEPTLVPGSGRAVNNGLTIR